VVDPLRVVDDTHEGLVRGSIGQEAQHGQPDAESVRSIAGLKTERRPECVSLWLRELVEVPEAWGTELMQPRERELHLRLDAGCPGDPAPSRAGDEVVQERRLPNSCLTAEDQGLADPRADICEQRVQGTALGGPAAQLRPVAPAPRLLISA